MKRPVTLPPPTALETLRGPAQTAICNSRAGINALGARRPARRRANTPIGRGQPRRYRINTRPCWTP
eukprot:2752374-Lingulodinium_polyedra.AAC.1